MLSNAEDEIKSEFLHYISMTDGGFETFQGLPGYRSTTFLHCYVTNKNQKLKQKGVTSEC